MAIRYIENNGVRRIQTWPEGQDAPTLKEGQMIIDRARFDELAPITKNPDGLMQWLLQQDEYFDLIENHGSKIAMFQDEVRLNRYSNALAIWSRLPVSEAFTSALFAADGPLVANGYQDLIDYVNSNA